MAAEMGEEVARAVGTAVVAALRGDDPNTGSVDANDTGTDLNGGDADPSSTSTSNGGPSAADNTAEADKSFWQRARDALTDPHATLGAASFIPGVLGSAASAADGALYAAQGKWADAGIALGAAAVGMVSDAGAARLAGKGLKAGAEAIGTTGHAAETGKLAHAAGDAGKTVPDGLAYRADLPRHLSGPDGFKPGKLYGTHNQQNAIAELKSQGAAYSIRPTSTPGVNELSYRVRNPNTGKTVEGTKTVYNSTVYSDQQMLGMAQRAGEKAFEAYKADPTQKSFDFTEGGVNFRSYINIDKVTGKPYVGNVHPIQ